MPVKNYARSELGYVLRDYPELLEVRDVATLTSTHERTVRRWLESGRLKGLQKSTRGFLIPKKALFNFLTNAQRAPGPDAEPYGDSAP